MLRPFTVDSSVFISALDERDPLSDSSRRWLGQVQSAGSDIVLPSIVLIEVLNVIRRRGTADRSYLKRVHQSIAGDPNINVINLDLAYVELYFKFPEAIQLKSHDLVIAMCAHASKSCLVSWDKKLLGQLKKHVAVATPAELI